MMLRGKVVEVKSGSLFQDKKARIVITFEEADAVPCFRGVQTAYMPGFNLNVEIVADLTIVDTQGGN